jgi:hypothetical protein
MFAAPAIAARVFRVDLMRNGSEKQESFDLLA